MGNNNNTSQGWESSLGDILNGKVKTNQLKPQQKLFDDIGMSNLLNDNTEHHLVLTVEEAKNIISEMTPVPNMLQSATGISTPEAFSRGIGEQISAITSGEAFTRGIDPNDPFSPIFKVTDPISVYAGNTTL
ncbi:hypothetical protein [Yersinia pseudotuberculosis]|uniref:hypothetical protein n=1 Tax=Yersinia pseudotuberculosis TaxID=633 RepID=UPI0005DFC047|nr:hypothetical protein [Yersinia pseudotuberculosis]CND51163.1 Uncharacterised protein [Yersinia pseudotuberculosis]